MALITELILNPQNILDAKLIGFSCELDEEETALHGRPIVKRPREGTFCYVFKLTKHDTVCCFRVWKDKALFNRIGLRDRLIHIKNFIVKHKEELPYFVNYDVLENALRDSDGSAYPGLSMAWVKGNNLQKFIKTNKSSPFILNQLANDFYVMCRTLNNMEMAHGDLSNSNIYVLPNGELRLVDYDSVYVPSMLDGFYQSTGGAPEFQHPDRIKKTANLKASAKDDYFSQQIIYLSLLAISYKPDLIDLISDKELLFSNIDLADDIAFISSRGYKAIVSIYNEEIIARLAELRRAINGKLENVRSVTDFNYKQSHFSFAKFCTNCGEKFEDPDFRFCTKCGAPRYLYQL